MCAFSLHRIIASSFCVLLFFYFWQIFNCAKDIMGTEIFANEKKKRKKKWREKDQIERTCAHIAQFMIDMRNLFINQVKRAKNAQEIHSCLKMKISQILKKEQKKKKMEQDELRNCIQVVFYLKIVKQLLRFNDGQRFLALIFLDTPNCNFDTQHTHTHTVCHSHDRLNLTLCRTQWFNACDKNYSFEKSNKKKKQNKCNQ